MFSSEFIEFFFQWFNFILVAFLIAYGFRRFIFDLLWESMQSEINQVYGLEKNLGELHEAAAKVEVSLIDQERDLALLQEKVSLWQQIWTVRQKNEQQRLLQMAKIVTKRRAQQSDQLFLQQLKQDTINSVLKQSQRQLQNQFASNVTLAQQYDRDLLNKYCE